MNSDRLVLWESPDAGQIAARIAIAGDFLPSGRLAVPVGGWSAAADGIASHFSDVDASFVNLESAIAADGLPARSLLGLGQVVQAPVDCLDYLKAIRVHSAGIANNHSYDFLATGVARTRAAVAQRDTAPIGAGRTLREPPEVFIWQRAGIRVGFWAAARACADLATSRTPGVEPATPARAREAIGCLQARGAHFSIALLHCGCLRTNRPAPEEAALMDGIARAGFHIVAASHSHRIAGARPIDTAQPSFCFYGLGSIVSGFVTAPIEAEGLVVVVSLNPHGRQVRIEVRPVWLAESGFGEVPQPHTAQAILHRFRALSAEIAEGSFEQAFYREISRGIARVYLRDVRAAFRESGIRGLLRKASRARLSHVRRLAYRITG